MELATTIHEASKKLMIFVLTFTFIFSFSINSFAYNLFPYELTGGVGNWGYSKRYFWIDSSASDISFTIYNAYYSWINTSDILSTPISWRDTDDKSSGIVELYTYNEDDGANGYTTFWKYGNGVSPNVENWGWCQIYYNNNYNAGQATLAHEIGHTMGHNENNSNKDSIMCQEYYGRRVSTPQYDDLAGINAKYN